MVTMAEIDVARDAVYLNRNGEESGALVDFRVQAAREEGRVEHSAVWYARQDALRQARANVEYLLSLWQAQGCREPMKGSFAEYETKVLSIIDRAERAEARAKEACDAMQSAMDRCRAACGYDATVKPSAPNDWVDEVIGLLRVTREQRDDAAQVANRAEASLKEKKEVLNEVFKALCAITPEIGDLANKDLAHAVAQAGRERNSAVESVHRTRRECNDYRHRITEAQARMKAAQEVLLDEARDPRARAGNALALLNGDAPPPPPPNLKPAAQEFLGAYSLEDVEITRRIIARADHLLKRPRCACGLHELPGASYVDDHLGHHKAKRCTLTFNRAPSEIRPFVVVAREKTAPETSPKTCGNCRDWIPGGATTAATCTLYKAPRSRDDEACHRFITGG